VSEGREWARLFLGYALVALGLSSFGLGLALWLGAGLSKEPVDAGLAVIIVLGCLSGVVLAAVGVSFVRKSIAPHR
jgi:hypothetical protein